MPAARARSSMLVPSYPRSLKTPTATSSNDVGSYGARRGATVVPTVGFTMLDSLLAVGFRQDNWQVRPNVTLTYGLRWEYLQSLLISALKRLAAVRLPPLPPLSILLSISYGLLLVSYNGILQGGFSAGLSRCSHYALIRTSFTRQGLHRTASAE